MITKFPDARYAIAREQVDSKWSMRIASWLDMKTMKPAFSIEVRVPRHRCWAHVFSSKTKRIRLFRSRETAARFMDSLKKPARTTTEDGK